MNADQVRRSIRPVILCGGVGSRLWPLSRSLHPKQLLAIGPGGTMLQKTVLRTIPPKFGRPLLLASEEHRFLVSAQLAELAVDPEAIILEPEGRNTAPAVALACYYDLLSDPDQLLLVMPSDHVIGDPDAFLAAVEAAVPVAEQGGIVTFGVQPAKADTAFGYIQAEPAGEGGQGVRKVARFVEKPNLETAQAYCESGDYFWNAGIFLFRASTIAEELNSHAPEVADCCRSAMINSKRDGAFLRPDAEAFSRSPSISLDYAVMEKTNRAWTAPVQMSWSDVGSWDALWDISVKDEQGNATSGDVVLVDAQRCLVRSESDVTVAALGIEDLIVVATRDAVFIAPRDRAQDTKRIVEALKAAGTDKHMTHPLVHRPWGTYETVDHGDRFQTKRIVVKPGEKLSLQLHHQRSEHWIVVQGTARVTVGNDVRLLQENESTYVASGTVHRLENPGKIPLHLIEVQCGPYLGEDDIVRIEDSYGRVQGVAG